MERHGKNIVSIQQQITETATTKNVVCNIFIDGVVDFKNKDLNKCNVVIYMQPTCTLIIGPLGCGKTCTLLHDIIEKEYKNVFDLIILCPTIWTNKTYTEWKYLDGDDDVLALEMPVDKLDAVLRFVIRMYGGSKTAVVIDE